MIGGMMAPRSFLAAGVEDRGYGVSKDLLVIPMTESRSKIWAERMTRARQI
jgi:hypothetical protein